MKHSFLRSSKIARWAPKLTPIAAILPLAVSPTLLAKEVAQDDQESIERVTIVGEFRPTEVADIPGSLTILGADDLAARQAKHLEEVIGMTANVNVASGGSRANYIQIRGIGERSQFVDPINPSVGLIVDGINYSGLGQAATLFDMAQVEVFRGPQSTRFGADAMAGMLYLTSERGDAFTDGQLELSYANYDSYGAGVALGGMPHDRIRLRGSLYHYQSDGFIHNTTLKRRDINGQDELTLRLNGDIELAPSWDLALTYHHFDIDNNYDAFSLDLDRTTLSDEPGKDTLYSHALRAALLYSGFEPADIELSLSYLDADQLYSFDEDWAFRGIAPGWEYSTFDAYDREREDFSGELRAISTQPLELMGLATDWVAGVYFRRNDMALTRAYSAFDYGTETSSTSFFDSLYETRNWAVYGELTQQWSERLQAAYGLRVQGYDNDYNDSRLINANPNDTTWGGRASVRYLLADGHTLYGALTRGFKQGGVNGEALGRAQDDGLQQVSDFLESVATFAPELLVSSELGYRWSLPAAGLQGRASIFYSWRDDMQVNAYVVREQQFVTYLDNASSGRNYGVELEAEYRPTAKLRLFGALGLLQTELRNFELESGQVLDGRDQAHAPSYQLHTGFEFAFTESLSWRFELDARDRFYFSNTHDQQASGYELLHMQLNYEVGQWQLSLWGRNLTDEDFATRGFYFGNDPRDAYAPKNYVQYGEPRRIGFTARMRF